MKHNIKLQNYYSSINNISDRLILPLNIDDESDTEYNEVSADDNNSDNEQSDIDLDTNYDNLEENQEQILGNMFTTEQCSIMKSMRFVEDMGCPDDAVEKILTWAGEAHLDGFKSNSYSKTRNENLKWMKKMVVNNDAFYPN